MKSRASLWGLGLALLMACGEQGESVGPGGGGGGGGGGVATVQGRVDDGFGSPVNGARVALTGQGEVSTTTGSDGVYAFLSVPSGTYQVTASRGGFRDTSEVIVLRAADNAFLDLSLSPETQPFAVVAATRILSMDPYAGMEFEADIAVLGADGSAVPGLSAAAFSMGQWVPWPSRAPMTTTMQGVTSVGGGTATPYSALLLMDQSGSIASTDPTNSRLLAGKVFLDALGPGDQVLLGAFAAGGSLPYDPVTLYGTGFTSNGRGYFQTVDQLASLIGGSTPLYRSTYSMLGYVGANAPTASKALIVFTDGQDTEGGPTVTNVADECIRQGVRLYLVGLGGGVNLDTLGWMAGECGGSVMRATDARQLVSLYGTLGAILGGTAAVYRTRWRANVASPGGGSCFCNFIYFDAPLQVAMPDGSYLVTPVWFRIPWPFPARAPTGRTDLPQGRTPAAG